MHSWDVSSAAEAVALQRRLAPLVSQQNGFALDAIHTIAGVDVSYRDVARAAVVVVSFPDLQVIEQAVATRASAFPYVPGLLSFRELPSALDALARLRQQPDLIICDGQGLAHPRRLGLASHLGVYIDRPTIGCAKSRLTGTYEEPGPQAGDRSPLLSRGEVIGVALRSKARTNPLFISIGHRIDLETAVEIVSRCLRGYRLPEPTRLADRLTKEGAKSSFPRAISPEIDR